MSRTIAAFVAASLIGTAAFVRAESKQPAGFKPLFNGADLSGWEGNRDVFSVQDGMIVGATQGRANNEFLATTTSHQDFYLHVAFRLVGGKGNSGIQFRSERIPNHHEMIGYQADVGENYWGCLYDESRRNRVLVQPPSEAIARLQKDGWNHYSIRCMNNRITMLLNGATVVDYQEKDANIAQTGRIALQVHSSKDPVRVEFKEIYLQEFPVAKTESSKTEGFILRSHRGADGAETRYSLFVPKGYHDDAAKKWRVILFLHGSGERGDDGQLSIKVGIGPAIAARADSFPFLVICPQAKQSWRADSADINTTLAILDEVSKEFRVDPERVHLTGLSMGGAGAWGLAAREPERWASVSPICGPGNPETISRFVKLLVWSFCGDADRKQTVENMRTMAAELKAKGATVTHTEYPGIGHNSWDLAYNNDELYAWMLKARRMK